MIIENNLTSRLKDVGRGLEHEFILRTNALKALINAHSPSKDKITFDDEIACEACYREDNYYSASYPCSVIRTIERELK